MKRVVDVLYGMKGYPNQERFDDFKADLFEQGVDVPILVDTINENTSGSGVTIDGVLLKDGTITTTAPLIHSVAPAVTAHAGGTKAAAFALTEEINIITVCATAGDSVLLPAAAVGQQITVVNLGVAALYVYGAGTNTIDDILTANPFIMQVEDVVVFNCYTTAKWQSDAEDEGVYGTLYVDTIAENTSATGVTIDSVLLKDGVGTFTAGVAGTGITIVADATVANAKYGIVVSKDLQRTAAGAVAQTNEAISVLSDNDSLTGATGAMTIANTVIYFAESNTTVVAQSDVYSGTLMVATYSATTASAGTATNSATGFLLDYNVTETAGTLSNTSFNVMFIDFDASGTPAFANGTYNMLLIDVDTAASLDASATAIVNGVKVDMSGTTVTDADLSLFGLNVLMPTLGTSAQIGARISDGARIVDLVNGTNAIALTGNILLTGTGVTAGHIIEVNATALTTGSLLDYVGITTKTGEYLFNGSMTTSTLTSNFLADDFSVACNHDGVGADTLRMIRRIWSGALPNGTLAADFIIAEFQYSGTAGTAASKTGNLIGVKIDLGSATINDSSLSVYGLYVDPTVTNTLSAGLYGIYEPGGDTPYIPFQVGAKASTAGSGLKLSGSGDNSSGVQLYFDDGGASVAGEVVSPIRSRMLVTVNQTSGTSVCGSFSQMVSLGTTGATKNLTTGALRAAYIFNQVGALTMTSAAEVTGINQAITVAGNTTVDTTSTFCGVDINIRGAGTVTPAGNGVVSALYIRSSETAQWTTAIKIKDAAAPTAIAIGTCTTAIDITDASGVTNLFKFNEAAGCILAVDVNPKDVPSEGGLGADACIKIDINGADYFIPLFATELSS